MDLPKLDFTYLRAEIVGVDATFRTPFGRRLLVYCDYTASGRTLDFIEEYLSMPIVGGSPREFYHAPAALQTLVRTDSTLEIYHCDWKTQVKLMRVAVLQNDNV